MYESINELNNFSYDDCVIKSVALRDNTLVLHVEALIVEPNNSQNTNYTRSYAGETDITFGNMHIDKAVKEGYRYYDANDVLQEEVPDTDLPEDALGELLSRLADTYLYDLQMLPENREDGKAVCVLGIEFPQDDDNDCSPTAESYQIKVSYEKVLVQWEKYMNRVEG